MSDSVTTSIEVAVPPEVAFDVFTREIDAWYQVDHDALPDITRTAAIRFEPQLGGRLLDVHDLESGEGRELARITAWEPGRLLAFVDNEATEVEVSFEPSSEGTRVTLTHRGLDRLGPQRAAKLQRSGWAALARRYREHLAPNARALAVVVVLYLLGSAILAGGFWLVFTLWEPKSFPAWPIFVIYVGAMIAVVCLYKPLLRRWAPSQWPFRTFRSRVELLWLLGVIPLAVYITSRQTAIGLIFLALIVSSLLQRWSVRHHGPARGRSLRSRAGSAEQSFYERHPPVFVSLLLVAVGVVSLGSWYGLSAIDEQLLWFLPPTALGLAAALQLRHFLSRRRQRRALGCDPDLYLAVERRLWEQDRRPELLVHRPSDEPEYSGWHAYASEGDEDSRDLVAWSIKDLVDQSPEAVRPLREGHGKWRWDQAERAYRPQVGVGRRTG